MGQDDHEVPIGRPIGELELVYAFTSGPMPTGVTVSSGGRLFVNYPLWGDDVPATVTELVEGRAVPYPDQAWNSDSGRPADQRLLSVQSVVVDPADRLWILDTGRPEMGPGQAGGPKMVGVDLATDTVSTVITFDADVVPPTTYLNDVRFDLRKNVAYITDSSDNGPNAIIVVDLGTGRARRRLHEHPSTKAERPPEYLPLVEGKVFRRRPVEGPASPVTMGADGIALSADGARLFYCPLMSRKLYSTSADALADWSVSDTDVESTVVDEGEKGGSADGLETDDAGRIYITNWEHNAVLRRTADGTFQTLVHDDRLLWPDTMSVGRGFLYVTANQLHRQAPYQGGRDLRRFPYALFRTPIDAGPVRLLP